MKNKLVIVISAFVFSINLNAQLTTNSSGNLITSKKIGIGLGVSNPDADLEVNGIIRSYNHSSDKYINLFGGNTGNIIDSYNNSLYLRIEGDSKKSIILNQDGNIGMGASSNAKLHVLSSAANDSNEHGVILGSGGNDGLAGGLKLHSYLPRFTLRDDSSNAKWFDFRVDTDKLIIGQGNNTDDFTRTVDNQVVIQNGNVGIGVSNPDADLEVNGIIRSYNHSSDKYINLFGGNTGNIIDSYNNSLYLRIEGDSKKSIILNQDGNIGMGASSNAKLHVFSSAANDSNEHGIILGSGGNDGLAGGLKLHSYLPRFTLRDDSSNAKWFDFRVDTDKLIIGQGNNTDDFTRTVDNQVVIQNGNVGIGTSKIDSKLTVAGNIHSREVKVTIKAGADFVFENDYKLPSLNNVELYIKENKHLPEIPSAKEMESNGLMLAEMNIKLLQKIEELTLYTINQEKDIQNLKVLVNQLIESK